MILLIPQWRKKQFSKVFIEQLLIIIIKRIYIILIVLLFTDINYLQNNGTT